MTEPTAEEVQDAADKAIEVLLKALCPSHLNTGKFIIAAESMDENGLRGVWVACGENQAYWESLGLSSFLSDALANGEDE